MNTYQAKKIPLRDLLTALGHVPHKEPSGELWYLSPFRQEAEPSFHINIEGNVWYDFGLGRGGNIIDFAQQYFQVTAISEVLRKLESHMGNPVSSPSPAPSPAKAAKVEPKETISVSKVQHLQNRALMGYLSKRGIDADVARNYVQEIYYSREDKSYFALAFPNQSGGFELRNPYYKGSFGHKDISFINPGSLNLEASVLVFEGFMDFLSFLVMQKQKESLMPVIVLNSNSMGEKAIRTIQDKALKTVHLYLDHDASGREWTNRFQRELPGVTVIDQSSLYAGHNDVNDFLQKQLQLQLS